MLLRSASTPLLGSLISVSNPKESLIQNDFVCSQISHTQPITAATRAPPQPVKADPTAAQSRAQSVLAGKTLDCISAEEGIGFGLVKTASLDCGVGHGLALEEWNEVFVGAGIGGGGKLWGGEGEYGEDAGDFGRDRMDEYYRRMIELDPGNPLLLSNYARFLMEVREDFMKAEECCGRAILANPNDGNVLSMYGDLILRSHKDASRAETYFNLAIRAAPYDCNVMASYAHFLWGVDEEEEDEEDGGVAEEEQQPRHTPQPSISHRGTVLTAGI